MKNDVDTSLLNAFKVFLPIAVKELQLSNTPKIKPVLRMPNKDGGQASFGCFNPTEGAIYVAIADRHPIDILRTLAHELVHHKQRENDELTKHSGETGSDEENEANARAGVIMRLFADSSPDLFNSELSLLREGEVEQVTTKTLQYHNELNANTWDNGILNQQVRLKLMQIAKLFIEYLDLPEFRIKDVVLTGSMANYNYTEYSDFDLHVLTDYADIKAEHIVEAFYRAKKQIWNDAHDITIYGHDVELYVEDVSDPPISGGVYSIVNNQWHIKPKHNPPYIDSSAVESKVFGLIKQIKDAMATSDPVDNDRIRVKLRNMRRSGLAQGGEWSVENLAFKVLRNMGYLNDLYTTMINQQDSELSL